MNRVTHRLRFIVGQPVSHSQPPKVLAVSLRMETACELLDAFRLTHSDPDGRLRTNSESIRYYGKTAEINSGRTNLSGNGTHSTLSLYHSRVY